MTETPFMPKATAVWLVENTTLTFKQIANFCNMHEVEIQGIADGEVAKGIKAYNPIISGQLSRDEIELSSKDENRPLQIKNTDIEISNNDQKIKKYVPLSKRQDKPDSALWLIKILLSTCCSSLPRFKILILASLPTLLRSTSINSLLKKELLIIESTLNATSFSI